MTLLGLCSATSAWADGVVRIADGDCAALSGAAGSPSGHEPTLIVLARNGFYQNCTLDIRGKIDIDGAGASIVPLPARQDSNPANQFVVEKGAHLTMRQVNFGYDKAHEAQALSVTKPNFIVAYEPVFMIHGDLVMESASIFDNVVSYHDAGSLGGGLFANDGNLTLRNVTITSNDALDEAAPLFSGGNVTIMASTIASNHGYVFGAGNIAIGNSVVVGNDRACSAKLTSLGGNVTDDSSCGLGGSKDRAVADAHLLELDTHGSVVKNIALRDDSPAVGNGVLSLCEATDARGVERGLTKCDSGAYEFGGGVGKLTDAGMSGVFYDSQHDGHYVSVQRLPNETALVVWNTFDQQGVPAWLFGVGNISGQDIHVDQFLRNVGGKLLPGGAVVGAHASIWGSFDLNLSDCRNATMSYTSTDPAFGSGSAPLLRVASIEGVDCSP
jgi:hypothetical protein